MVAHTWKKKLSLKDNFWKKKGKLKISTALQSTSIYSADLEVYFVILLINNHVNAICLSIISFIGRKYINKWLFSLFEIQCLIKEATELHNKTKLCNARDYD